MQRLGIDVLLVQSNNDFVGEYVRYLSGVPATNGYPVTVVFPRDDEMTLVRQGTLGGDFAAGSVGRVLGHGVKRILTTASWASASFTKNYEAELAKLDRFDLLILDDLSYARRDQAETSVLFELIAEHYERKSIAITANAPFSAWDEVFPDKAMTLAAVDRLVHHATILEMNVDSYRRRAAQPKLDDQRPIAPLKIIDADRSG